MPGPQVPLYLAGARMLTFHPLSIVMHGLALNITVQTYAGRVDFGVVADRKAVPQLQALADALERAFDEACRVFAAPAAAATPEQTRKPRVAKATRKPGASSKKAAKAPPARPRKAATV